MLKDKKTVKWDWLYLIPLAIFIYFAAFTPVIITHDSDQYIAMHIHRDPFYPLFLWAFRRVIGENSYQTVVVWIQNILAWVALVDVTNTAKRVYKLKTIQTILVGILMLMPHIFTPVAAQSGLILTNGIMSEAIALSLFYFFMASMMRMMETGSRIDTYGALVIAWIMSLTRGQMQVFLIVWVIVRIAGVLRVEKKKMLQIAIALAAFVCSFGIRSLSVKAYNLEFNRYFTATTFSEVNVLTNIIYASDMEDLQYIEDEEAARFARLTMEKADEEKMNYKYSPEGLYARGVDLEAVHDKIKYQCMDEYWRPVHDAEYPEFKDDYELETIEQDRVAAIIIKDLFPHVIATWLYDYLALCIFGFVRTVAIARPIFVAYTIILFSLLIVLTIMEMKKEYKKSGNPITGNPLLRLTLFVLLCTCANVCGTATVIMCLSRYMIYMMPFIYAVVMMWVWKIFREVTR